eukprot:768294-Hanusia_phi.AAC.3
MVEVEQERRTESVCGGWDACHIQRDDPLQLALSSPQLVPLVSLLALEESELLRSKEKRERKGRREKGKLRGCGLKGRERKRGEGSGGRCCWGTHGGCGEEAGGAEEEEAELKGVREKVGQEEEEGWNIGGDHRPWRKEGWSLAQVAC